MKMNTPDGQETPFFGDLLKRFRQRKRLTQQQLAKRIGVHRDSIGSWERGEFFPEIPTSLHEIARELDLSEDEKRLLFETLYGTASMLPLHNFPEHNSYFTGREAILAQLHAQLTAGKSVALIQTQAISGLGGIGKTQVAIEYAYRFREHYHDMLWVDAESRETLMTSYLTLARHLRLLEREEREQHKVIEAVKRWLREHRQWLLILDNIEDLGLVREFVPTPRQGAVVLTTRRGETRPVAEALILEDLHEEEALLFLLRRAGHVPKEAPLETASAGERAAALALVQTVGGLPLALDQAGAYVAETECSLSDYLDLFKQRQKALLDRRGTLAYEHPRSVVATFLLAFEQVQQKNAAAIDLLKLCAYLAPDAIPLEIFTKGAAYLGTVLGPVADDALQLDQAVETLLAYSLVRRTGESRILSIHRLVQAVLQDTLAAEQHAWTERTVLAVNAAFPDTEYSTWSQCERLLPHALLVAEYIKTNPIISEEAGRLLNETARYLYERAQYPQALPLYQRALHIREQQLGPEHLDVTSTLHNLANLYREQGKYAEAEPLFQRALHIREQQLGPEHPNVATSLNSLANLYREQSRYGEAEPLFQRALHIREQQLGPEHPQVASTLDNLANLYREQGKYAEAEPLFQRALHIRKQQLDIDHPQVAISLNNLAELYREQGKYAEAEPLYQRALHIWEQRLGLEHPNVAYSLGGLANLYREQGKYAEAEPLYRRALHIWEQQPGSEHPQMAYSLGGLANLYREQSRYAEAEPLYQRALHIREQQLGPDHLQTAETMHDLARLREVQGNRDEAKPLYEHALAVREHIFGPEHPKTKETRKRYITLLREIGQDDEAEALEAMQSETRKTEEEQERRPEE